jgi:hypothetical protein
MVVAALWWPIRQQCASCALCDLFTQRSSVLALPFDLAFSTTVYCSLLQACSQLVTGFLRTLPPAACPPLLTL